VLENNLIAHILYKGKFQLSKKMTLSYVSNYKILISVISCDMAYKSDIILN